MMDLTSTIGPFLPSLVLQLGSTIFPYGLGSIGRCCFPYSGNLTGGGPLLLITPGLEDTIGTIMS